MAVEGNTYPVREQIKALGGKWDAGKKLWMVPSANWYAAAMIVTGAEKATAAPSYASGGAPGRCIDCGAHSGKYRRCYDCQQEEN